MAEKQELVTYGQRFNRLTVIGEIDRSNPNAPRVVVKCDCGVKKSVIINQMKNGRTKSCGCLNKERIRAVSNLSWNRKHNR
jgi:hypothetical protein